MKLHLVKTEYGLIPCDDEDSIKYKRIKRNIPLEYTVTQPRNIDLHRKFFSLISTAYKNRHERSIHNNLEHFREDLTILAGHYEVRRFLDGREEVRAKSISFAKMEQHEFDEFYDKFVNVILKHVLKGTSNEELRKEIALNY